MAILVVVCIPFMFSVAILSIFMGRGKVVPTEVSLFSQGCAFDYASAPMFVLPVFQVLSS